MAEGRDSSGSIPWPAILTILSAIGGVILFYPPLQSSRPSVPQGPPSSYIGYQDIDARLWQDPVEAVRSFIERGAEEQLDTDPHQLRTIRQQISKVRQQNHRTPKILAVLSSGLPYAEDAESRLRARLAVASGLARAGFRPNDSEHLGMFAVYWPLELDLRTEKPGTPAGQPTNIEALPKDFLKPGPGKPIVYIPYEWWTTKETPTLPAALQDVLVLWLREESFDDFPLRRLSDLLYGMRIDAKGNADQGFPDVTILGPAWSNTLQRMTNEAEYGVSNSTRKALRSVSILSHSATGSDDLLRLHVDPPHRWIGDDLPEDWFQQNAGLKSFHRTIASDDVSARTLVNELKLRGVNFQAGCHIALISEFDTPYGRWLPVTFAAQVQRMIEQMSGKSPVTHPSDLVVDPLRWPACVDRFSYLRGIDGQLPGDQGSRERSDSSEGSAATQLQDMSGVKVPTGSGTAEDTEGHNQADSLRRLSDQILEKDREYRMHGDGYIQAVGVLGSDVYDKLLILKALRKQFPATLFFTTDLDARYSNPAEFTATHNLIVVSPFDLRLNHETPTDEALHTGTDGLIPASALQGDIPPFRDDYQTSLFLSTLVATGRTAMPPDDLIRNVRTFEIGRHGPVNLSPYSAIQPSWDDASEWLAHVGWLGWLGVVAICAMAYSLICYFRPTLASDSNDAQRDLSRWNRFWKWPPSAWIFVAFLVLITIAFLAAAYRASDVDGEPWALMDGVSIWPTEIVRLVCACLAIGFMFDTYRRLDESEAQIRARLEFRRLPTDRTWRITNWETKPGESADVVGLWRKVVRCSSTPRRLVRVGLMVLLYAVFLAIVLGCILRSPIVVPGRGPRSYFIDFCCMGFSSLMMMVLNFYVGDAAQVSKRFALGLVAAAWPTKFLDATAKVRKLDVADVSEYLTVDLLAHRTEAIRRLLYYPFIVLILMIVARNKYFDNWGWPLPLLFVFTAHLSYALYQYVTLGRAAERVRSNAVFQIKLRIQGSDDKNRRRRLRAMLKEVVDMDEGAYASFWKNPVVGALLVPLAGFGGWLLIQLFIQNG